MNPPVGHEDLHLDEYETLTRAYSRYSRSAGGLGSVIGGVLTLVSYFLGALLPLTPALSIGLIAIPFVWLLAKGGLVRRYYQRFGRVEERLSKAQRRSRRFNLAVSTLIALAIVGVVLSREWPQLWSLSPRDIAYLVLVLMIPIAVWRWLRSPLDFIVGVFLFCQAAVVSVGLSYPLIGTTQGYEATMMSLVALIFPVAAVVMIRAGIIEHRRFLRLRARLDELSRLPAVD
ncbi:MAG: hypothetical protein L0I62_09725 [Gammaproteobacteria bacterium]|nr:hypothetical protein [Gammaproteobacteria bacterium]